MFNEEALYLAIIDVWGPHGAHADVFRALHRAAGDAVMPIDFVSINLAWEAKQ